MNVFEYKVVPAPDRGKRGKGIKGGPARFAHGLEQLMNDLAVQGWEYQRADTLPCEERVGLTGKTTVYQNMLVFRRAKPTTVTDDQVAALLTAPAPQDTKEPECDKSTAAAAAAAALRDAPQAETPRGLAAE